MRKIILFVLFVSFLNANLKECINKTIGKPITHNPTTQELLSITSLSCLYKGKIDLTMLRNLKNVKTIKIRGNFINAPLPNWVGELNKLQYLDLSGNRIRGKIPKEIGSLISLKFLDLSVNNFSNDIQMSSVNYNINKASGIAEFGNDIYATMALHPIPNEILNLVNLEELHLESSNLTGTIPKELGYLSNLKKIYLQNNNFFGTIPNELGYLSNLKVLRLDDNNLFGQIPINFIDLNLSQPSGLNLQKNCNLKADDNTLKTWINTKSSFYGGVTKMKSTGGFCKNPAVIPALLYLLGD